MEPSLVTLAVFQHRDEAELAKARLAAEGIDALIRQDNEGGLNPGFYAHYGVRIQVRTDDLEGAQRLLADATEIVWLPGQIEEAMVAHTKFMLPLEACGLLAMDHEGSIRFAYSTTNVEQSPHRFTVDPSEHFFAIRHAERAGWEIAGDFHSHPKSGARPSANDVAGALDPSWVHFVIGLAGAARPEIRAYRIEGGRSSELAVLHDSPENGGAR